MGEIHVLGLSEEDVGTRGSGHLSAQGHAHCKAAFTAKGHWGLSPVEPDHSHIRPLTLPASEGPDVKCKQQQHEKEEVTFVSAPCLVIYVRDDTCSTNQVNFVRLVLAACWAHS